MTVKTESLEFFNKKHLVYSKTKGCMIVDECSFIGDKILLKDWPSGIVQLTFEIEDEGRLTGEKFTVKKEYEVSKYDDFLFEAKLKK